MVKYHRRVDQRFSVRRVTLEDVDLLVDLRYQMQVELDEGTRHGIDPADIRGDTREYFIKQLTGFHFAAFFVEIAGEVVGTGGIVVYDVPPSPSNPSGAEGYIMNMYTMPEHRGHGVAHAVLDSLIDHAYKEGARRVWLRSSESGQRVYKHYGFESPGHYMQMFLHGEGV